MKRPGLILVISGPSGAGKSTTLRKAMEFCPDIRFSISATTREPREGEQDSVHYFFVDEAKFEQMRDEGKLMEYAEYAGNYYGTPAGLVLESIEQGMVAVLDIETNGAMQVRRAYPDSVLVYICPSDIGEVERRLRGRKTESEEKIRRRMACMEEQMRAIPEYDYYVLNDSLDDAVHSLLAIIEAERCRTSRCAPPCIHAKEDVL